MLTTAVTAGAAKLDNILGDKTDTLDSYEDDDWRWPINKGDYVQGLVTAVDQKAAAIKLGSLHLRSRRRISTWTTRKSLPPTC